MSQPEMEPAGSPETPNPEAESPETETSLQPETQPAAEEAAERDGADEDAERQGTDEDVAREDETVAVSFSAEEILGGEDVEEEPAVVSVADAQLLAVLEAIIYVTDEPLTLDQIAEATEQPHERIALLLEQLCAEYDRPERGLSIREVAGGFRMTTKAEHHEAVRRFVKNLNPPVKLSLPALETLAVIAYKQPITAPEIMDIRGVQGAGVLKTLLDRKLIAAAGRKQVIGKPILYKTTREFLVQFGLKNLQELPTLKEFQEIGSLAGGEPAGPVQANLIEMPVQPDDDEISDDVSEAPEESSGEASHETGESDGETDSDAPPAAEKEQE